MNDEEKRELEYALISYRTSNISLENRVYEFIDGKGTIENILVSINNSKESLNKISKIIKKEDIDE